jgi:lipoprotein-releasing system permease protein
MATPLELFMAWRFLRDGRMQTLLIITGVAVGVGVIVFLSALISGLQDNLIAQTLGSQAHIVVRAADESPRRLWPGASDMTVLSRVDTPPLPGLQIPRPEQQLALLRHMPGVLAASAVAAGPAFAQRGDVRRAVLVRGVDLASLDPIIPIGHKVVTGAGLERGGPLEGEEVLIGVELARDFGLEPGDRLRLSTSDETASVFSVRGVFDLGNREVNARSVFMAQRAAQSLLGLGADVTELLLSVQAVYEADAIAAQISRDSGLRSESWMTLNAQLLTGLRSQSASSAMIQVFIVVAVAMGIASVLVVSVIQRSREIGILRAMGTSRARVMRIFLIQGGIVGLVGSAGGVLLGSGLAAFFEAFARNTDGTPTFPIAIELPLIATAVLFAIGTGIVAALWPARRAARLDPVAAIRSE